MNSYNYYYTLITIFNETKLHKVNGLNNFQDAFIFDLKEMR